MTSRKQPPRWQEGSHTFEVTIPAEKTKSGKEETVTLGFRWKVHATKPKRARGQNLSEITWAKNALAAARSLAVSGKENERTVQELSSALDNAVMAWCKTHLRGEGAGYDAHYAAFYAKAPSDLRTRVLLAFHQMRRGDSLPWDLPKNFETICDIVQLLLEAIAHPPRNQRRFPAPLRAFRPPNKPCVKVSGWIDTGRYRPAQVMAIAADPPHTMRISYGDSEEDFHPHISNWHTVRCPKQLRSLKDIFEEGDWLRHEWYGYGRVIAVANTIIEVEFRGKKTALAPDPNLEKIVKVDGPEAPDERPIAERFPSGTWIRQDVFGEGVVLDAGEEIVDDTREDALTVCFGNRIVEIIASGGGPMVWRLERPPLDLQLPWHAKAFSFLRNDQVANRYLMCPCCGYPNATDVYGLQEVRCVLCGWIDDGWPESQADKIRSVEERLFSDEPIPNENYSLTEARRNVMVAGHMFRQDTPTAALMIKHESDREHLRQCFDSLLTESLGEATDMLREIDRASRELAMTLRGLDE